MHVNAGQPMSHREFGQLMSELQFTAELEKQLKKETEEESDTDQRPMPSNGTGEVSSSLIGKIAFNGKV